MIVLAEKLVEQAKALQQPHTVIRFQPKNWQKLFHPIFRIENSTISDHQTILTFVEEAKNRLQEPGPLDCEA